MISLHLAVEIYAGIAVVASIASTIWLLVEFKTNPGPRTWVGKLGAALFTLLVVGPLWLPLAVVLGVGVLVMIADDKLGQRREIKAARKLTKDRGECPECHKQLSYAQYNPAMYTIISHEKNRALNDALRAFEDFKYYNPKPVSINPGMYNAPNYEVYAHDDPYRYKCKCDSCRKARGER